MKRINDKKNLYKSIILLVILVIGIGYAYLTSNLSITGATEVVANTWDIHFENLNISTGSVTASTGASINASGDAISYTINLNRPKDYYEFTVDVKNDGTLPGKVSISSLSGLDTTSSKIIDYSVTYINGNSVKIGDILNAGAKKSIKVRTFYKDEIDPTDFPATDLNLTLTYTLQYVQSDEDEVTIDTIIQNLKTNNSTCFTKYEGNVTDRVGTTEEATNVYFDECSDKRNIIFGGFCWQMIRTTETGGMKMIYNGEPVNGKCEPTRGNHTGILGAVDSSQTLNSNYKYGENFIYDTTSNTFTLTDTTTAIWSDSTYENLIGKYTCKSNDETCTTLYRVEQYNSNIEGFLSSYTIGTTNYSKIGDTFFNYNNNTPAMGGYMFNKIYFEEIIENDLWLNTYKYGSSYTYDNGVYTLGGETRTFRMGSNPVNLLHYTCRNTTGTCSNLTFLLVQDQPSSLIIMLSNGLSQIDLLNQMMNDDNVNRYDSSIKSYIESWYKGNLIIYNDKIEDTIYCNDRTINNVGYWGEDSELGIQIITDSLSFGSYSGLSCEIITDQFAVSNNKAKLKYPIALLSNKEVFLINDKSLLTTDHDYWLLSPSSLFSSTGPGIIYIMAFNSTGKRTSYKANNSSGIRPVISLKANNVISKGDGTETNPWIIE